MFFRKKLKHIFPLCFFFISAVYAQNKTSNFNLTIKPFLAYGYGWQGETLYYSSGYKCSYLEWEEKNVISAGATIQGMIYNVGFSLGGEAGIPMRCGKMYDSDWIYTSAYPDGLKTTYSISENSLKAKYAAHVGIFYQFDIKNIISISPAMQADYTYTSFEARNGYGWYGKAEHSQNKENVSYDSEYAAFYPKLYGIDLKRHTVNFWTGISLAASFKQKVTIGTDFFIAPVSYCATLDHHLGKDGGYNTQTFIYSNFKTFKGTVYFLYKIHKLCTLKTDIAVRYGTTARGTAYSDYYGSMAETRQQGSAHFFLASVRIGCKFKIK